MHITRQEFNRIRACLWVISFTFPVLSHAGEARMPPEELASFILADPALKIELVCAEPDVISPVAIAWDAQGRMFVAEMIDYPVGPGSGRIRMLEDKDGDGRYETARIFAEHLSFPNSVLPWNGGLFVTAAPDLLYLKDTDDDGRADERRVVFTGFGEGNQQLRANGLLWGLDGWIYGANGRSDGEVHRPGDTNQVSLRGHDFRFSPNDNAFEALAGRSQFGLGLDEWGNRFLSWNTIPIRHEVLPEQYLLRNPRLPITGAIQNVMPPEDDGSIYPQTPTPKTFNQESTSHFNALAGLMIYKGDSLPPRYYGNAFVGETLRNLVHRRVLQSNDMTFTAKRGEQGKEFLASTDPWFHPVNFATGPDGALYVVDFYRQWVEHPGYVPEKMRGAADWREGSDYGRIWRVRGSDSSRKIPTPPLSRAGISDLIGNLEAANAWRRETAHRLLVERRDPEAPGLLRELVVRSSMPQSRLLALSALNLLDQLDETNLVAALQDSSPRVREAAVKLSESRLATSAGLQRLVSTLAQDKDSRVRLQTALSIGMAPSELRIDTLLKLSQQTPLGEIMSLAIRSSLGDRPWPLVEQLVWMERPSAPRDDSRLEFMRTLAAELGIGGPDTDRSSLLSMLVNSAERGLSATHLALFVGLVNGWASADPNWRERLHPLLESEERKNWLKNVVKLAERTAMDPSSSEISRRHALIVLARAGTPESSAALHSCLSPPHPTELQSAAAAAIGQFAEAGQVRSAYTNWNTYSLSTRRAMLNSAIRSTETMILLVEAVEQGRIAAAELDPATRERLQANRKPELAARVEKIFGPHNSPDRQKVLEGFAPSLALTGEPKNGGVIFARACLNCHQLQSRGQRVGPDLAGVGTRPKEALLEDILDPSRHVPSDFVIYTVLSHSGESSSGLLVSETSGGVTLRRPGLADELIPRDQIKELQANDRSLMPDGLEAGLSQQDMADLIAFLSHPDPTLLPP